MKRPIKKIDKVNCGKCNDHIIISNIELEKILEQRQKINYSRQKEEYICPKCGYDNSNYIFSIENVMIRPNDIVNQLLMYHELENIREIREKEGAI